MWRLLLLCFIAGVSGSNDGAAGDDDTCSTFRLKRFGFRKLNSERLRIGVIDSDRLETVGGEFSLTIDHAGTTKVETKQGMPDGVEDGVYKFQLNNISRASLAKKRRLPLHRFTFIYITITYEKNADNVNEPKFTKLKIGTTACTVPEFKPKFKCPQLPAECPSGLVGIVNRGFKLHLPVIQMYYFHLKIGFKNSQKVLKLQNQRNSIIKQLKAQASDCNETVHFIGRARFKRRARARGIDLEFFTGKQNHAPQIEFIEYGNRMCKATCGTDPCKFVEPTTTPAPATTTVAPATTSTVTPATTSTEAPAVTSTEAPAVTSTEAPATTSTEAPATTSTEAPATTSTEAPAVTSTEAPAVTSTEAPVVTSTEAPVVTSTEAPVVTSTEAPVVTSTEAPVVTSTEAPVVTSTEAPVVTSTEAPVVTSTEAPVVTSTEAPAVSSEAPTASTEAPALTTETPADEVLKELEDLEDEDFSVLDEDLW